MFSSRYRSYLYDYRETEEKGSAELGPGSFVCYVKEDERSAFRSAVATHQRVLVDLWVEVQQLRVQGDDVILADAVRLLVVQVQQKVLLCHSDVE